MSMMMSIHRTQKNSDLQSHTRDKHEEKLFNAPFCVRTSGAIEIEELHLRGHREVSGTKVVRVGEIVPGTVGA
jgi:hypothetical protein